jgi:hypothetical protein
LETENQRPASQALQLIVSKGIDLKSFSGRLFSDSPGIQEGKSNPANKRINETEDIKINKTAMARYYRKYYSRITTNSKSYLFAI